MADHEAEAAAIQKTLGYRIRRRRMMLGYMQPELSTRSGIAQAHISRAERGLYKTVSPWMLVQLAKTLHTTVDYLLGLSDDPGSIPVDVSHERVA
jgi:transcriptional regulator with XRE-family HTH domain